ncbi:S-layer homology domain-containing protein [Paenibacillus sinopodophylli]|uniref:S-layer homology domain-containing protein n=1 Tax=Paenibacillus sinopodophylli TaxID=1837342 RepID=UPI00110CC46F|nr:S-layer homology domain-containing protein [Paenibacillus sinopodophylli]
MHLFRKRGLRFFSSFVALSMIMSSFSGMVFAISAGGGTAAEATSKAISNFDFSGGNSKTITISDGSVEPGHTVDLTLAQNLVDMQGIVNLLNDASALATTDIVAHVNSPNTFRLTSSVIGKTSRISISGPNASDFFATSQYSGLPTDEESVEETKISLSPFYESDEGMGYVLSNMTLPGTDIINGTAISWSTDNAAVITDSGIVTREASNTNVTLTATITKGAVIDTQTFVITVIGTEPAVVLTDEESVANTKAGLTPFYDTDESEGYVKGNMTLPLTDVIHFTSISWSSSNSAIIDHTGVVNRPSVTTIVTLTAAITKNAVTDWVSFNVSVIGIDSELVNIAKGDLNPIYASGDSEASVTQNLQLPLASNNVTISWDSSNPMHLANNGLVTRKAFVDGSVNVVLTATLTKGQAVDTKIFNMTIRPLDETEFEAVAFAKSNIALGYVSGDSASYVTGNLLLDTAGAHGTAVTWSSSSPTIISNTGIVNRPVGASNANVTLTATITKGAASDTQTFDVTVMGTVTDLESVANTKAGLMPLYDTDESEGYVKGNLSLPLTDDINLTSISWSSNQPAILSNSGIVNRPSATTTVILTATITRGLITDTAVFHVSVIGVDSELIQIEKSILNPTYGTGDTEASVTQNLALPLASNDVMISWSSSDLKYVANNGVVTRPAFVNGPANVMLTATLMKGEVVETKIFNLTINPLAAEPVVIPVTTLPTPAFEMTSATKSLIEALGAGVVVAPVEISTSSTGYSLTKVKQAELLVRMNGTDTKAVIVPVANTNGRAVVSLTPGLLAIMKQKDEQSKVVFQSGGVTYEVPAAFADTAAVAKALGLSDSVVKDAELRITIETIPTDTVIGQITNAGGKLVASLVSFSIEVVTPDKTYDFNDFRGTFIKRSFDLNTSVDSTRTVGILINQNGTITPVPTVFTKVDGKPVAIIKVDHNSTYTIIEHASMLSDIGSSWAKDKIETLANKKIINGYEDGTFKPNGHVTRAEFASMIAKGLGLNEDSSAITFSDVSKESWYAGAVGAMSSRGFISGYSDGSFKADQKITREEEAVILARVLAYLKQDVNSSSSTLDQFGDHASISEYARVSVGALVELKMMNGDTQGNVNPQGYATRAETATLVYNLLSLVEFLNE